MNCLIKVIRLPNLTVMPRRLGILHASVKSRFRPKSFRTIDSKKLPCFKCMQAYTYLLHRQPLCVLVSMLKEIAERLE